MDSYVRGVIKESIFDLREIIEQLEELDEYSITRSDINRFIKTLKNRIWFFNQAKKSVD